MKKVDENVVKVLQLPPPSGRERTLATELAKWEELLDPSKWRYEDLSIRIPDDHKHQTGDHVTLTYNDTTYETVIDSIKPDGDGFIRVRARFLLP